jgi:hypothetical protein
MTYRDWGTEPVRCTYMGEARTVSDWKIKLVACRKGGSGLVAGSGGREILLLEGGCSNENSVLST